MAEIDALSQAQYFAGTLEQSRLLTQEKKQGNKASTVKKSAFQTLVETQTQDESRGLIVDFPEIAGLSYEDAIVVLKDALDRAGDELKADGATEHFVAYKTAVTNFMKFVVGNNYELESSVGRKRSDGTRKQFFLIKVVDEKLDQLAAEVLSNHADKLALLAKIDEINGILVDLVS
jgi:uncharacterized protein YaaR (DUF327 family)